VLYKLAFIKIIIIIIIIMDFILLESTAMHL